MKFNEFLKKRREKINLTQVDAATHIGVSVPTIQNWERGDNRPEINAIPCIAKAYNLEIEEVLRRFAADLNIIDYKEQEAINVIRYKDALPENLLLDAIEGLYFTEQEQELFLIFALNLECCGNPVPQMSDVCISNLELALFFDKMKKYKIYKHDENYLSLYSSYGVGDVYSKGIYLTDIGNFVYDKIKKSKGELFNVYKLHFRELLILLSLYEKRNKKKDNNTEMKNIKNYNNNDISLTDMSIVIQELVSEEYFLEKYELPSYYISSSYKNYNKEDIFSNHFLTKRKDCLKLIDDSYYEIIEIEWENEEYKMDKEIYFKKLDFYNENKDLIEDLTVPYKYDKKVLLKAVPTEKAKLFVEFLNNNN